MEAKLTQRRSPEEISGWLTRTYPNRPEMQVSHEAIQLRGLVLALSQGQRAERRPGVRRPFLERPTGDDINQWEVGCVAAGKALVSNSNDTGGT